MLSKTGKYILQYLCVNLLRLQSGMYVPLIGVITSFFYIPIVPADGIPRPGIGPNKNMFSLNQPLFINMTGIAGNNKNYVLQFINFSRCSKSIYNLNLSRAHAISKKCASVKKMTKLESE